MTEAGRDVIRHYLEDLVTAEKDFEQQLRDFSRSGDDEEVRAVLAGHADETKRQHQRLATRLGEIGGRVSSRKAGFASIVNFAPQLPKPAEIVEEKTLQSLLVAYTLEAGEFAVYETLAIVARAAGDYDTEQLAKQIQAEERNAAEKIWHFLSSRSKIAFNMLTVSEIDPAVETKMADDRIIEG